ncbi:hypothetical protein B0T13DRAFT_450263 [Neurospora crassa]|nr:hypothetical protein B0T13DRAFT_450263 [Neurospora crassa]
MRIHRRRGFYWGYALRVRWFNPLNERFLLTAASLLPPSPPLAPPLSLRIISIEAYEPSKGTSLNYRLNIRLIILLSFKLYIFTQILLPLYKIFEVSIEVPYSFLKLLQTIQKGYKRLYYIYFRIREPSLYFDLIFSYSILEPRYLIKLKSLPLLSLLHIFIFNIKSGDKSSVLGRTNYNTKGNSSYISSRLRVVLYFLSKTKVYSPGASLIIVKIYDRVSPLTLRNNYKRKI